MKKVISIVLALTLVLALFVPTAVNAADAGVKLTIDENYDVNAFGRNPAISTTQLVEKDGKWALKYSQVQGETDPFYALPNEYRNSFNGDYHYAVWDVYYEPDADSIGTILSYRLNYNLDTIGSTWMQRHVILWPSDGGHWVKVLFDMTYATTNPLTTFTQSFELYPTMENGGATYENGAVFNDSRVYFSTAPDGNIGDNYYLHEIAMFKTLEDAYVYMGKDVKANNDEPLDETAQIYSYSNLDSGLGAYSFAGAESTGFQFTIPEGKEASQLVFLAAPTYSNVGCLGSDVSATLYAWNTDYATSVAGTPVASTQNYSHVDCHDLVLDFGKNIPAGEYLLIIKCTGDYVVGTWGSTAQGNAGSLIYVNDGPVANWYANFAAMLVEPGSEPIAPETNEPETTTPVAPQTGDMSVAMFAVVAVMALAAAVIFKKRVNG